MEGEVKPVSDVKSRLASTLFNVSRATDMIKSHQRDIESLSAEVANLKEEIDRLNELLSDSEGWHVRLGVKHAKVAYEWTNLRNEPNVVETRHPIKPSAFIEFLISQVSKDLSDAEVRLANAVSRAEAYLGSIAE